MLLIIILAIFSYFIGSISFSIILSKLLRLDDPRTYGSKNAGATNVARKAGKKIGMLVLILDALKGLFALMIAKMFHLSEFCLALMLFFVVLGHIAPMFFKFKGGKGVATLFGGLFIISWPLSLIMLLCWACVFVYTKYSSLSSISSMTFGLLFGWIFLGLSYFPVFIALILVILMHLNNIKRLVNSSESTIN